MPQFKFNTISRTDIEGSLGGNMMLYAIDYDGLDNLLIIGCPGSGKTTVSIMRAERLALEGKDIALITYQDLLTTSLKNIASRNVRRNIVKFYSWFKKSSDGQDLDERTADELLEGLKDLEPIDEFIIDEGQDLEQRFYQVLLKKCKRISVGADNAQMIHEFGTTSNLIKSELTVNGAAPKVVSLQYNYRNTYETYNFARHFLSLNERANNELVIKQMTKGNGALPVVFLVPDYDSQLAQIQILLRDAGDRNVAILLYYRRDVKRFYEALTGLGINCSKHYSGDHVNGTIENVVVTTFKSAKGLEFQVVIMPDMHAAMKEHYQTPEHYYVGCTRAKENLYVLVNNRELPGFFEVFDKSSFTINRTPKMNPTRQKASPTDDLPF